MVLKQKTKLKKFQTSNAGFSLIEILVSMVIFALIIGGVILFSVRTIEAHTKSRAMQNAIDNARFAIESINKKIRTSHNITDGGSNDFTREDEVFIIDNVDMNKYCYRFDATNGKLTVASLPPSSGATNCGAFGVGSFSDLVGDGARIKASGGFYVKDTSASDRGFVRTVITIEYDDVAVSPAERDRITIQSSVSVRDY